MSDKHLLRKTRFGTVINTESKIEDKQCVVAIDTVKQRLENEFGIKIKHYKKLALKDIVEHLKTAFNDVDFYCHFENTFIAPDGGVTTIVDKNGNEYPIVIVEVKNQGTNDVREQEGKKKQARGNAIERLGKNVIGLRTYMLTENIFPFICFGDGCDFVDESSILDRVSTIAMFGKLNTQYVHNQGRNGCFNRGSYFFRKEKWTLDEMIKNIYDVAKKGVYYYFSKYGEENFK